MSDRLTRLMDLHRQDPDDAFCTYALAMEHAKREAWDEAVGWLEKTIELDADQPYAYFQKARCLIERGEEQPARDALDQGLEAARRAGNQKAIDELTELRATLAR